MGAVGHIDTRKCFVSSNYSPRKEELSHVFTIFVASMLDKTTSVNFFFFYVLLTVHPSIMLVIDQLNAKRNIINLL